MDNPKLTITLTGRAPVTITKDRWPIIASAKDWDNQYECQANRTWNLTVRQHEDGRAIVYGRYGTNCQSESCRRGGRMLDAGDDIPAAIIDVAETLEFERRLADECIADLPAEEIEE